ncbi:hypothetical protein IJ596_03060, partial [bacterium]|nr:hypothetical protein [bacterium]
MAKGFREINIIHRTQDAKKFVKSVAQDDDFQKWEAERKSRLFNLFLNELGIFSIFILGLLFIPFITTPVARVIYTLLNIIFLTCFIYLPTRANKDFKSEFKDFYCKKVEDFFDLTHYVNSGIDKYFLNGCKLFPHIEKVYGDDCYVGVYNDVLFQAAEVNLIDVRELKDGNTQELNVFEGVVIMFDSNKKIESDTIVTPKRNFWIFNKFNMGNILIPIIFLLLINIPLISDCMQYGDSAEFIKIIINAMILPYICLFLIFFLVSLFLNRFTINDKDMERVYLEDVKFDK